MDERIERLIDNALIAYSRCENSGSKWGQQYWQIVLNTLLRKYAKVH